MRQNSKCVTHTARALLVSIGTLDGPILPYLCRFRAVQETPDDHFLCKATMHPSSFIDESYPPPPPCELREQHQNPKI